MCDRKSGIKALSLVTKNAKDLEKIIHATCSKHGEDFYKRVVYQAVQDLMVGSTTTQVVESIKDGRVGVRHSSYDSIRARREEQEEFLVNPFHVEEGVMECGKCKSKRVISYSKQTRGADEPASVFCTCTKCGNQWGYSG